MNIQEWFDVSLIIYPRALNMKSSKIDPKLWQQFIWAMRENSLIL